MIEDFKENIRLCGSEYRRELPPSGTSISNLGFVVSADSLAAESPASFTINEGTAGGTINVPEGSVVKLLTLEYRFTMRYTNATSGPYILSFDFRLRENGVYSDIHTDELELVEGCDVTSEDTIQGDLETMLENTNIYQRTLNQDDLIQVVLAEERPTVITLCGDREVKLLAYGVVENIDSDQWSVDTDHPELSSVWVF